MEGLLPVVLVHFIIHYYAHNVIMDHNLDICDKLYSFVYVFIVNSIG